jgi:hypothetical protein
MEATDGKTAVYRAINAVQKALASRGITKDRRNQQQGYQFRGIDDIYNVVSPLLGEHGLCILPYVLSRTCVERQTKNGGVLFYVVVEVNFEFVATEDGSRHVVKTFGEAMDSADKATNKAMSAAYKYSVMQSFAIPTEGSNDADETTPEVAPGLTEHVVADYLSDIAGAGDMDELKNVFTAAVALAKQGGDAAAVKRFIAGKEARKNELTKAA